MSYWIKYIRFIKSKIAELQIIVTSFKINWIKVLFFVFSFMTFLSHGFTNVIFINKIRFSSGILALLLVNVVFFTLGKIYGTLVNVIPLRLVSYIFLIHATLSLPFMFKNIVINAIFTYLKSFLYGIQYAVIFSMMSDKTERWKLKKFTFPILIFILINILPHIVIYFIGSVKFYFTIIMDILVVIIFYKLSSGEIKISEIIDDKLIDYRLIFNGFFNSINSIIIFIIQRERDILVAQLALILMLLIKIIFIILINKNIVFQNPQTYYYILIKTLEFIANHTKNDVIKHHIEQICHKLKYKMLKQSLNDFDMEVKIIKSKEENFLKRIVNKLRRK